VSAAGGFSGRRVPTVKRLVWEPGDEGLRRRPDELAVEEPLEIRLSKNGGATTTQTVTMRTPGHDFELVAGWLLSEGLIRGPGELRAVRYCTDPALDAEQRYNVVTADLARVAEDRLKSSGATSRLALTSSSCGVCGTASIELLLERGIGAVESDQVFSLAELLTWPDRLREDQVGFSTTGGLHAAGLVSSEGELVVTREDIGRHNAVDKVIGWALLRALEKTGDFPLSSCGLVVSGRTSFEIVQKALSAGIPVVAGVSAASSLAARLAEEKGLSLAGFVRDGRVTIYTHPERLTP
jgi:FdhD protein